MLKALLQPTLVRRITVTLLLVSLLVWALLIAYYYNLETGERASSERVRERGNAIAAVLNAIPSTEQAVAAAQHFAALFNTPYAGQPGFLLQLRDPQGQLLYQSQPALAFGAEADQVTEQTIAGQQYRLYRVTSAQWDLQIAVQGPKPQALLQRLASNLTMSVVLAFPIILVPVLLAVRRGLKPLQQLSAALAKRSAEDLSPVDPPVDYLELTPLVAALNQLLQQLKQKIAREHAFVQQAAHELRTPLAVITAQAHALAKQTSDAQRQAARVDLERSVQRSSHLIDQLLLLARMDAQLPLQLQTLDVAAFVQQVLADVAITALASDVELSLDAPDSVPFTTDVTLLHTILHNLLGNALKYASAGKVIEVQLHADKHELHVAVADAGPGIAESDQAAVFERFYRVAGSQSSGSGLGLAIVQQAVTCLQGRLALTTGLHGRGCRFVIALPRLTIKGVEI